MAAVWQANLEVEQLVEKVRLKHHVPRLATASVAVCFTDSKPFVHGRFNWGKVNKFSTIAKLYQSKSYDFLITLCADAWLSILGEKQREALVDLHLERCQVDYEPLTVEVNGKKQPVKDEWGRVQVSDVVKTDDDGVPKWKVYPLDLLVFQRNVMRYGCWSEDMIDFKSAIDKKEEE